MSSPYSRAEWRQVTPQQACEWVRTHGPSRATFLEDRRGVPVANLVGGEGWRLFRALGSQGNWDLIEIVPDEEKEAAPCLRK